jgi:hypothetical protein
MVKGKILLIYGIQLPLQIKVVILIGSPIDQMRFHSKKFHPHDLISDTKQIFNAWNIKSTKMIRRKANKESKCPLSFGI